MKRVHKVSGKTIVLITHDIDEALLLATKIVLLNKGQIVQVGSPLELLTDPANDFVVDFLGRSDLGIKRLSLETAGALARPEAVVDGPSLPADASLREVVSFMAVHRVMQVNVISVDGTHAGVAHAADIFSRFTPL